MGIFRNRSNTRVESASPRAKTTFSTVIGDPSSDYNTWLALVGGGNTSITLDDAMKIPAVLSTRNIIAGTLGTMPVHTYRWANGDQQRVQSSFLDQPENLLGYVRSYTIAYTIEDLIFRAVSCWYITTRAWDGFPASVERVPYGDYQQSNGDFYVRGTKVRSEDVILFHSLNPPLLKYGAPAITMFKMLNLAALGITDTHQMVEYFTNSDPAAEPLDPDMIGDFLGSWKTAREKGKSGYIPPDLQYNSVKRLTSEEMQLIDARQFAVTEIARLTSMDPFFLGINIGQGTYRNAQETKQNLIDTTFAPFISAVEERLSLNDTCPAGQYVRFNTANYLRYDLPTRYESYQTGLQNGFLTMDEVRKLENRGPLPEDGEETS